MADWTKIKAEYIADPSMSYRKLAEKHGISRSTLQKTATAEGWPKLRSRKDAKTVAKIVDACATEEARKALKVLGAADKAIDTIIRILQAQTLTPQEIKSLTSALRDLAAVLGIRTELDMREQEARIAKLQREAERENAEKEPMELVFRIQGMSDEEAEQVIGLEQFNRFAR